MPLDGGLRPNEISDLTEVEGHDYLTLFTCTPYAVNTHRLLVRGERVPYTPEVAAASAMAETPVFKYEPWMGWLIAGALSGLLPLIVIVVRERRGSKMRSLTAQTSRTSGATRRRHGLDHRSGGAS